MFRSVVVGNYDSRFYRGCHSASERLASNYFHVNIGCISCSVHASSVEGAWSCSLRMHLTLACSFGGHKSAKLVPPDCCHVVQRVKAWDGCGRARSLNPQT